MTSDPHDPGRPAPRRSVPILIALALLVAFVARGREGVAWLLALVRDEPLQFTPRHLPVGYDASEVLDAAAVDVDHDGDADFVVARADDVRWLWNDGGRIVDATPGTGLDGLPPVERLHADGDDFVVARGATLARLAYTGIGSWDEVAAPVPARAPAVTLEVRADLDGDGRADRAWADASGVHVAFGDASGGERELTREVGVDALRCATSVRRLAACDLEGDGDLDLLVVCGRLYVLVNQGGRAPLAEAAAKDAVARELGRGAGDATSGAVRAPWFTDVARQAGLAFVHREGDEQWDIRPTMGPGAAFSDVDGDGDQDFYVAGGSGQAGVLYANEGTGTFADASARWRLDVDTGAGMGVSFCDYDGDGDEDLYVTNDGPNTLFRHDGEGFTDVTAASGTGDAGWGASAAWADVDKDGDLDLYVTNYLTFDVSLIPPEDPHDRRREDPIAMLPYVFPGQANVFYRNEGDGRFSDATEAAGLLAPDDKSLGAVFLDDDQDGWPDLYVANDTTPNTFWHNRGDGTFEEQALFVGLDDPRGGMGLAPGDVDADGDEDVLLTNWQLEPNGLYRSNAVHGATTRRFVPRFEDVAVQSGLAQPSVGKVGWGCVLADLDADGDLDAYVCNGYTSPDYETTMRCVGQTDQLFENVSPPRAPGAPVDHKDVPTFRPVPVEEAGAAFELSYSSRGLACADVDADGDLDLLVTSNNGPLVLLRNERGGRTLRVVCEGRVEREAVGARVTLVLADGSERVAAVHRDGSYLSGHERGVFFGLGAATPARVRVAWPDGATSEHDVHGERVLRVVQPE